MKEFTTAIAEIEDDDAREEKVLGYMAEGLSREAAEKKVDGENERKPIPFKIDGRVLYAHRPHDGQIAFMMASLGRGQSNANRFAAIINVMLETLRGEDKDWLEERLLTGDKSRTIPPKTLEEVFEYLSEAWFQDDDVSEDGEAV